MNYVASLDGVRALSVLAVVAFHSSLNPMAGGYIGVDVFFVLSGFLITTILRDELGKSGTINLKRFYVRRLVRLMPPLVLCLAGTFCFYAVFFPDIDLKTDILFSLFYISDYGYAFWRIPYYLKHTWSLSVEEHFYILWPVLLILTRKWSAGRLGFFIAVLFVAATIWRFVDTFIWEAFTPTYYRFDTRASGLLLGAMVAVLLPKVGNRSANLMGLLSGAILVLGMVRFHWASMSYLYVGELFMEIAAAGLVLSLMLDRETFLSRFMSHPWLVYLGTLSYSIYLWHFGLVIVLRDRMSPMATFAIVFGASFVIAALSHRYVEAPLRSWVRRVPRAKKRAAQSAMP